MNNRGLSISRFRAFATGAIAIACLLLGAIGEVKPEDRASTPGAPIRDAGHRFRGHARSWLELQRQNVVMQKRDYSCGAAALATLLRYHWGDDFTEARLLQQVVGMLTVDEMKERIENGLSLTDLRRLAVRVGYQASIGRLKLKDLSESKIPLVVGIVVNDFDHFVVYRGTDGRYVYLADPARGNVRTPTQEFLKQWQKNMALVVVKPGHGEKARVSPLMVQPDEVLLDDTNRLYLRDRVTSKAFPH